ncbi:hypothetical protein SDC9_201358 [bioreactor metagenome]|uniref:Glycosyl transferase family 1 domain-containing protein n=1 Tax=bioreactor metagenome TaxID=1076179 RepID=A0A645IS92_9ZZZZ
MIENGVNGLIVEKKNPKAIADAVLQLKKDQELYRRLSEGAKDIFKEKFTLDSMSQNIERQYFEVLNRRGE